MSSSSHFLQFVGGLAIFFFGLFTTNQNFKIFAGDRLKSLISRATENRWRGLLTGMVVTFFLQSSSATSVMLVGFASSGLISLEQAMAVLLGAGIGTTFVVFLFSSQTIASSGLVIIIIGMCIRYLNGRRSVQTLGEIIYGFGFVFYGLTLMSEATTPLKTEPLILSAFQFMEGHLYACFFLGMIVTSLVHSSSVMMGILMSLAHSNSISFEMALPIILGINLGTSTTALWTTFGANTAGKRTAWANFLLRLGAILIILPIINLIVPHLHNLINWIIQLISGSNVTLSAQIALTHFLFNVFVAIFFLPFLPLGKKCVCWLIPQSTQDTQEFGPLYLDENALSTPTLAFAQIKREIMRMGEIVQNMLKQCVLLFEKYDFDLVAKLESSDHQVDKLYKSIKFYLARISLKNLPEGDTNQSIYLITGVSELENIGDAITQHLLRLSHKKWNKGVEFSSEGWNELRDVHQQTNELLNLAMAAISSDSAELAIRLKSLVSHYLEKEDHLKMSHLLRLNQGLKESIETSAVHLEILSVFHNINHSLSLMVSHLIPGDKKKQLVFD